MSNALRVNGPRLSMETLKNFLWPIVAIGGFGAFIDFLIGKAGQEKAKDFLLRWWVRFDDVRWKNFGREEGLFAGRLIEKWFGQKIWSARRIVAAFTVFCIFYLIGSITIYARINHDIEMGVSRIKYSWCAICNVGIQRAVVDLIVSYLSFATGVSFTKFITLRLAYLSEDRKVKNLIMFFSMLIISYMSLLLWSPITEWIRSDIMFLLGGDKTLRFVLGDLLGQMMNHIIELFTSAYPQVFVYMLQSNSLDVFAFYALALFSPVFRLLLSVTFVGSFLLKPLIIRPASLVWARIVESAKPVFTLIFGGATAVAKVISEAVEHP
jgi:hypothetical protein